MGHRRCPACLALFVTRPGATLPRPDIGDLVAGITVAMVALPLSLAIAIAAGWGASAAFRMLRSR